MHYFIFYLGFLSRTVTIHRTASEGGGYLFNYSLPIPPASQHLNISQAINAENSPQHIACSWTRTGNLWFPSASRQPLSCAKKFYEGGFGLLVTDTNLKQKKYLHQKDS